MKLAKRVSFIRPSPTLAINAQVKEMKKKGFMIISFAAGEPDFDTPNYIKEEAKKAIEEGFTKYTPASGMESLKEVICKKFKEDNGLDYDPSQIIVSCGAKHSLYNTLLALCNPGDEVLLPSPYWVSYPEQIKFVGATPVIMETKEKESFKLNPVKLEEKITKKTKLLIINSPHNPTGTVYKKEELEKIAEIALKHHIYILSDEIYEKIIYDHQKHISIASLNSEIKDLTIVINGVSKTYAMTGWRIGYAAGNKEIIKAMGKIQSQTTSNANSIAQRASLAALSKGEKEVEKMVGEFKKRRDYVFDRLNKIPKISCLKPQGAFYAFPNIAKLNFDSLTFANLLLEKAKVAVVPGEAFGAREHLRLSFATSLENIEEGLNRIEKIMR